MTPLTTQLSIIITALEQHKFNFPPQTSRQEIISFDKYKLYDETKCTYLKSKDSAGALIFNPDLTKILLVKGKVGHKIGPPKGHKEKIETNLETMIREVKEETNVDIRLKLPLLPSVVSNKVKLYLAILSEDIPISLCDTDEIESVYWYDVELLKMTIKEKPKLFNNCLRHLFLDQTKLDVVIHKIQSYSLNYHKHINTHLYKLRQQLHNLVAFNTHFSPSEMNYIYFYVIQKMYNNIFTNTELIQFIILHF